MFVGLIRYKMPIDGTSSGHGATGATLDKGLFPKR